MVWIYILELKDGKYYVGKSNNPDARILDHFKGSGSIWTKKYEPIKIIEKIPDCDDYDEDKYTKIYMDIYGIDNVRGGSYITLILDESIIKELKRSSTATNNRCLGCDKKGHFIKNCPDKNLKQISTVTNKFNVKCKRCGHNNHKKKHCFAKKDINGNIIKNNVCLRCGRSCVTELCKKTHDILGKIIDNNNTIINMIKIDSFEISNIIIDKLKENKVEIINTINDKLKDDVIIDEVEIINNVTNDKFQDDTNVVINITELYPYKEIIDNYKNNSTNNINPIYFNEPVYMFDNSLLNNEQIVVNNQSNIGCTLIIIFIVVIFTIGCALIGRQL